LIAKLDLWDEPESTFATVGKNGVLKSLESYPAEPFSPISADDVVGSWESQEVRSSGTAACIVGYCNSSITDRTLEFTKDGHYRYTLNGKSSFYFDTGLSTSLSKGNNEDGMSGTYQIINNTIVFTESDGRTTELAVHLFNEGNLAVGKIQYERQ